MKPPRTAFNRRELLRLNRRGGETTTEADSPRITAESRAGDLVRAHRPAMGSFFEIRLPVGVPGAVDLASAALDVVDSLEAQLTVYNDESEVSRLNSRAHQGAVEVERALFELIERAVALSQETGGAYDVTSGALSEAWGFVRGPRKIPDPMSLADARARTGWRHLKLDRERQTVSFDRAGVRINLGSIGKGYAIDRAADVIRRHWWPSPALIHGGRSSLFAIGSPPGRVGGRWEIALRNPFEPDASLGVIQLRNRGLGTSGSAFQQFMIDGRVYGHIIDPRTGQPACGAPASVTVLAPTAAQADALSTAFYLLGHDAAAEYIVRHPEIGAIFVEAGSSDPTPCVRTIGLTKFDFVAELIAVN